MVTWSEITRWQRGPLEGAIQAAHDRRNTLERVADDLQIRRDSLTAQGETADAIRAALERTASDIDDLVAQYSELLMATAEASDGVWQIETAVHECFTTADIVGLIISGSGTVSIADWKRAEIREAQRFGGMATGLGAELAKQRLADDISTVLSRANEVDAAYRARLDALDALDATETATAFSPGLPDRPIEGWSPTEVAAWWEGLTQSERDLIIANDPDAIGNLNGIDAAARDRANRNRIDSLIAAAEETLESEYSALMNSNGYTVTGYVDALHRLHDLQRVRESLSQWPDASLLVLDATSGDHVRAAMAIGDVDHAEHVGTYVPGMTTTVRDSLNGSLTQVDDLRRLAIEQSGLRHSDVAVIAWLGYDAPPDVVGAASTSEAVEGAAELGSFLEGVQASRDANAGDAHMSVFGHSYGSTTSGLMAAEVSVGVLDDLVLFGSPGSGVQDVREYNLDEGSAYVSAVDSHDIVQGVGPDGWFGVNPTRLDGVEHLSNDGPPANGWSINPAHRHSDYLRWNPDGSPTGILRDFADVLAGAK